MGGALLASWLSAGILPEFITVLETKPGFKVAPPGIVQVSSLGDISQFPGCIVLAVKPQSMDALLPQLKQKYGAGAKPLYLSIAAGKPLSYFARHLGAEKPVVRAMPNTPALIGKGITAMCSNNAADAQDKKLATSLLQSAGEVVWLEEESQMDAVTAISGSGPAYVFLFMEALIAAGVESGLSETISKKLVCQTILGSAELAMRSSESLSALRENVTSPGGTTAAALEILMKNDAFKTLLATAVRQAKKRAGELA